jgi:hypothetical protein
MNRPRLHTTTVTIRFETFRFDQRLRDARAPHAPGRKAVTA